ncbi:unnamed protein product, partial [Effrenium voratum]
RSLPGASAMGATLRRCWHATGAISSSSWPPTPHPTFHPNSPARVRGIGFSCFFGLLYGLGWLLAVLACPLHRNVQCAVHCRPISYINYCGTADATSCTLRSARLGVLFAKQSRCTAQQHRRQSATVSCTEWTGCAEDHVVMDCRWEGDHDVPGRHAPDGTSVLRPASDIDWTKYIFEQFSLRVDPHQILFYGRPTPEEEEHKMAVWPPKKGTDHVYLRQALLKRGLLTLGE